MRLVVVAAGADARAAELVHEALLGRPVDRVGSEVVGQIDDLRLARRVRTRRRRCRARLRRRAFATRALSSRPSEQLRDDLPASHVHPEHGTERRQDEDKQHAQQAISPPSQGAGEILRDRSNSATIGGCSQACTSASTWPAPISGESVVMGAVKKAAAIVMGWAKAAAAPTCRVFRWRAIQKARFSRRPPPPGAPDGDERRRRSGRNPPAEPAGHGATPAECGPARPGRPAPARAAPRACRRRARLPTTTSVRRPGVADALRQVRVALVDQDALESGQGLAELGHQLRDHVLLAQLAQVVLGELRLARRGSRRRSRSAATSSTATATPRHGAGSRARRGRTATTGMPRASAACARLEQLAARQHAERAAELLLIGGEHQVGEQRRELALADHLLRSSSSQRCRFESAW